MRQLLNAEIKNVAGGSQSSVHVDVTAQNVQYLHVGVDVYNQQQQVPAIHTHNNIYIANNR
ncbi:MAG: hypothetical protein AB7I18_00725 [Candidatus Berkiella sp.]